LRQEEIATGHLHEENWAHNLTPWTVVSKFNIISSHYLDKDFMAPFINMCL
jgi:hypothetical protein